MATAIALATISANDDATFRLWGKSYSDTLQAAGATKLTAGEASGQINWATVTYPAAPGYAGYEMYRFSDTLQTTYPVIIKITYGRGSYPQIIVQVGKAQDGAGTFVGLTTTAVTYTHTQNYAVPTLAANRVAAGSNYLVFHFGFNPGAGTNQPYFLSVERTKTAAGLDTNRGIAVLHGNAANAWSNHLYAFDGGEISKNDSTKLEVLVPSVGHGSTGTITAVYPAWYYAGPYAGQHTGVVFAFPGNVTSGVSFTVTIAGSSKTYLPLTSQYDAGLLARLNITLVTCIRWD